MNITTESRVPRLTTALTGPLQHLEKHFLTHQVAIETWFRHQWQQTHPPIYSSVDLRNAGFKLAPVDTNLFPAGFNNLNPDFMPLCVQAIQATMAEICPSAKRVLLIPESHSRNQFYFESLGMLFDILQRAGFEVRIGSLDPSLTEPRQHALASGKSITVAPLQRQAGRVGVDDFFPCCIILNNDMSDGIPEMLLDLEQTLMPSAKLGWNNRLKSKHFAYYEQVVTAFAEEIDLDPWLLMPYFDQCPEVDFMKKEGQECLVNRASGLLKRIEKKYQQYNIKEKPFLVVKADQGTYGMAVMMIHEPQELENLNRKQRSRMASVKGGVAVTKAIIQEGVHTFETWGKDKAVAEPVVYMIGRHVVGGFYRVHEGRGAMENLNAPGMNFQPLAFADPCQSPNDGKETENRFYAYGVVARLASLAAARELAALDKRDD